MLSSRAAFASLPPLSLPPPSFAAAPAPAAAAAAVAAAMPSAAPSPARPIPRSPYVRSPRPPSPAPLHDVLCERDTVGPGLRLQGELIRPLAPHTRPQQFEVVRKLGSGSYAVVYLVRERRSAPPPAPPLGDLDLDLAFAPDDLDLPPAAPVRYGAEFAIKCLSKANLNRDALDAQLFEATVHQSLPEHPNIVTLHRTLESDSFLLLVLECVPGEDLFYFLEQARDHPDADARALHADARSRPPPATTPPTPSLLSSLHPAQLLSPNRLRLIASMFAQMCDAVAHCHSVSVFHRDIKPENFIVTDGWAARERKVVVKLTDFGLATTDPESADMDCGSAPYMSYECRNNCAPTYSTAAADVWSLGIVLINMLYHHNPWSDTTAGACPSFEAFRAQPVPFFMQRFPGMTRPVADFLATRVFCILDDSPAPQRVSAAAFGRWVRALPALLAHVDTPAQSLARLPPVAPTPPSRRPSSRPPSRGPTPLDSRPPSQPEFELAEPDLPEADEPDEPEPFSRTTSTARRRKRGARKGRGARSPAGGDAAPDPLEDLAAASQVLAREISKASKAAPARAPPPSPPPAAKKSKWKGVFRIASADAEDDDADAAAAAAADTPSATAENVSTLIMGLSPAPRPEWRGRRWPSPHRGGAESSNWRSASSASSMSGTSSFTRFSNGSVRSVSTVATSVSAAESWRQHAPPAAAPKDPDPDPDAPREPPPPAAKTKPPLPANLKMISGVPWELHELPRGCHVRPHEHVFAPPPLRYTMKAQARAEALGTISERARSPAASSGDEEPDGGAGPKKVQKGQIHALAKMLSALKANRGAH